MPDASTTHAGTQPAGDDTSGAEPEPARASATTASPALDTGLTSSEPPARTHAIPFRITPQRSIDEG